MAASAAASDLSPTTPRRWRLRDLHAATPYPSRPSRPSRRVLDVCHCATFEAKLNTAVMRQFLKSESGWDYIWRKRKELIKLRDELAAESGLVVPPWCVFLEYKRRLGLVT